MMAKKSAERALTAPKEKKVDAPDPLTQWAELREEWLARQVAVVRQMKGDE